MNRIELINHFIAQRNYARYLEISVHAPHNGFSWVHCAYKKTTFPGSAEQFFGQSKEKFDLVFVDGLHTEEQAAKDIAASLDCLNPGGVIIIHDCMPPDAWHQREYHEFAEGEVWNGAVWKVALRVFNSSTFKCSLLDTDWGCGIIDTSQTQVPVCKLLPAKLNYQQHYPWLLQYSTSVFAYLREQVKVFYHLACMGNWKEVFAEQLQQLAGSGFYSLNITALGSEEDIREAKSIAAGCHMQLNILFTSRDFACFERPALLALEQYARVNEGYVLYLHSKGVSNPADSSKIKWRRLMMQQLVENWEHCMTQLPRFDVIGVNWREMHPTSHFCGNFWYASTRYVRKLVDFDYYYEHPRYQIWDAVNNKRLGCEFWISSAREKPKVLSLYCQDVDFCNHAYWR